MTTKTTTFKFEKATKNTYKFQEEGKQNLVGQLYVQKHAFAELEGEPTTISVTIEY